MVIFLQYVTIHNIYTIILFRVDQERKDTKRRDGQHMSPAEQSHPALATMPWGVASSPRAPFSLCRGDHSPGRLGSTRISTCMEIANCLAYS